jgi:hypothetical protein
MTSASDLRRFQRWMQREVSSPIDRRRLGASRRRRIEREVEPSSSLDAVGRLAIYAESIQARLVECLEQDFPATRRALGRPGFDRAARAYVERRPPRHFSLNRLGDRFPRFLRDLPRSVPRRALAADLAEIERAIQEVFDAPRETRLGVQEIEAAAEKDGARLRLRAISALRLVETRFAADRYVQAVLEGRRPTATRRRTTTLVWRSGHDVRRRDLEREEAELLAELLRGARLGVALGRSRAPGRRIRRWFRAWGAAGLFAGVETD